MRKVGEQNLNAHPLSPTNYIGISRSSSAKTGGDIGCCQQIARGSTSSMVNSNNPSWLLIYMPALSKACLQFWLRFRDMKRQFLVSAVNYAALTALLLI